MVDRAQLQRLAQEVETLRKRLEEINLRIEQVDAVLAEHAITDAVLETLLNHGKGTSISTHLPIGSGVSLPYVHEDTEEGLALVDLGSGVFGERPWSDTRSLTQKRRNDIQRLRDELKQQSDQTETSLGQAAQTFNSLAETIKKQAAAEPVATTKTEEADAPASTPPTPAPTPRRSRKRGMFGGDLTLDD